MARNNYTLDGVPLTDPALRWFPERDGTGIRAYPARRSTNLQYPTLDGESFNPGASFEAGYVKIRLYIEGKTHEEFMENYEFIMGIVGQRHKPLELVHHYDAQGNNNRVALVSFPDSSELAMDGPTRGQIDLHGVVLSTFWRSAQTFEWTYSPIDPSSTITTLTPFTGGNAPITDALIRFKGGFGMTVMNDIASGSQLRVETALTSNEYIIVDTLNWTARKVTGDTWEGGVNVDNLVVSNRGSGTMFEIAPHRVGSSLVYQVNVPTTNPMNSPAATIRARKAYL